MLDHLRLSIPVLPIYVSTVDNHHLFNGDLLALDLPCATRHVSRAEDGQVLTGTLYHPYESLPSSYTDMAMKFFTDTMNIQPYVELKASPLKLLQGHNVFGFECIKNGAMEMLGLLMTAHPQLCKILDFSKTEVLHLDTTYFFRLPHQNQVQPVLDYLSSCSAGHRKARQVKYENYVTWGNDSGRYINIKAYGKYEELQEQMKKLQRSAVKGNYRSQCLLYEMNKVLEFAKGTVRLEARICKTFLTKNGYPTNLWELINYQAKNPNMLSTLWNIAFSPILSTLKGEVMRFNSDDEVLELLKSKLWTITAKGRKSYTPANNAFQFYNLIQKLGWEQVKKITTERSFYRNVKNLVDCGISRSHLQNLHKDMGGKVIPFTRLVEIDFSQQLPQGYVMPISQYIELEDEQSKVA